MNRFRTTTVSTPTSSSGDQFKLSKWLDVEIEKAVKEIEAADRTVTGVSIASHSGTYIMGLIATISHVGREDA